MCVAFGDLTADMVARGDLLRMFVAFADLPSVTETNPTENFLHQTVR